MGQQLIVTLYEGTAPPGPSWENVIATPGCCPAVQWPATSVQCPVTTTTNGARYIVHHVSSSCAIIYQILDCRFGLTEESARGILNTWISTAERLATPAVQDQTGTVKTRIKVRILSQFIFSISPLQTVPRGEGRASARLVNMSHT